MRENISVPKETLAKERKNFSTRRKGGSCRGENGKKEGVLPIESKKGLG